jgi:hypothetical protein
MKIGFSFGRCVRDIVNGDVNIDDVVVVVAKTMMRSDEDVLSVVRQYMFRWDYLAGLDDAKCQEVALELWNSGRLHQPRVLGLYASMTPEEFVWLDLVPTANNQSPWVKEAWENYQMALRLSEDNLPDVPNADDLK